MELKKLNIEQIKPNPFQPREKFKKEELQELADNIKTHGMIEPVVVTPKGKNYMIVAGERRWRANKLAKQSKIFAIVKNYNSDSDIKRDSLIENEMRENLSNEEFKTYCYSLAKSLKIPIDKQLPRKLASYILGSETASNNSPIRLRLGEILIVDNAPKKIQKFVEKGNIDLHTAARIEGIQDKEAKAEVIKMVEEKAKAEPGVTPKITITAIRNAVKQKNEEERSNKEREKLAKEESEEKKRITEQNILNRVTLEIGDGKDAIHKVSNQIYSIKQKAFLKKLSQDARLSIMDDLKSLKKEMDRANHIVTKTMELIGGI